MKSLLIVEDEKLIRKGLRVMAERSPVAIEEILECRNGEEALALLRSRQVDAMLTDIRMPKLDGIQLVRSLRDIPDPPLAVVVSGFDDFSYAVDMLREGVRDYILKPVEPDQFNQVLAKLEEELQSRSRAQRNELHISHQILRALILNEAMAPAELQAILEQYGDLFLPGDYVMLCGTNDPLPPLPDGLNLRDVAGQQLLLLPAGGLDGALSGLEGRCLGASAPHRGLDSLREAYREAREARGRAFAAGRHVSWGEAAPRVQPVDIQKELVRVVQLLGTSNAQEAKKLLAGILLHAQTGRLAPGDFAAAMEDLVSMISSAYGLILTGEEELVPFGNVWGYPSARDFHNALCAWIDRFCRSLAEEFEDYQNKQKIQSATIYIRENYQKPINMATVSNHVSMNYSLFSYLFKQYTGANFVSYLRDLRIEKSKELLAATDLRVLEISARVGFQDEKHFTKTFKSICGVSPSEYRKNKQYSQGGPGE